MQLLSSHNYVISFTQHERNVLSNFEENIFIYSKNLFCSSIYVFMKVHGLLMKVAMRILFGLCFDFHDLFS
jgi:hypothetical protein